MRLPPGCPLLPVAAAGTADVQILDSPAQICVGPGVIRAGAGVLQDALDLLARLLAAGDALVLRQALGLKLVLPPQLLAQEERLGGGRVLGVVAAGGAAGVHGGAAVLALVAALGALVVGVDDDVRGGDGAVGAVVVVGAGAA